MVRTSLAALLLALVVASPAAAETRLVSLAEDGTLNGWFAQLEAHGSLLSDVADRSLLAGTFGGAARGGYRWQGWGAFLHIEQDSWLTTDNKTEVVQGAVNIGVGGEYTFAEGFVRTSVAVGPSILLFETVLDDPGSVGVFLDTRPLGLRWTLHEHFALGLDPIGFTVVAPVLDGIPLVQVEYRTALYVEGAW
ncbi:MAG: hypothetical protein KC620_09370 [Myxococcales bacterium]|nr:hypothetical protein [Myxococcales bacterium]